jgi:hypothetical protein
MHIDNLYENRTAFKNMQYCKSNAIKHLQVHDPKMQSASCELKSVSCELQNANCELKSVSFELQISSCELKLQLCELS